MTNCIGALDGKHIQFKVPLSQGSLYRNYKGTDSIVLLAVVDASYKFLYVNVGVNGRVSDGGVFRDSDLFRLLDSPVNPLNIPPNKPLPRMTQPVPHVILADAAFPLLNNILKPYPFRNMTHSERIFNYRRLSRARRVVKNAFSILANRFRVLQTTICLLVETVQNVTLACCALHNFLNKENPFLNRITNVDDINYGSSKYNNQLQSLSVINVRPSRNSLHVRSTCKEYFNTVGAVSWQENML
ncbi:putative nuclease HARBI1 [Ooceraea biroi]|uniref:putative nuclease HARBI1 n=1 Tax=Ooceraea biroi TaxID=2015173 RepID=UPI000F097241|nr:putative nuclease HARBI1 [Ooceraea biroi]